MIVFRWSFGGISFRFWIFFSSFSFSAFKALREGTGVVTPKWLTFDAQNLTGTVAAMPAREDIDCPIEEHLIVELYSR